MSVSGCMDMKPRINYVVEIHEASRGPSAAAEPLFV